MESKPAGICLAPGQGLRIAAVGKGGSGKTMLVATMTRILASMGHLRVLAIDADSSVSLPYALGMEDGPTVSSLRSHLIEDPQARKEAADRHVSRLIGDMLQRGPGFDLLVMGRPEGAGCYCAANNIIRKYMDKLADTYPFTVMDNEAGLEHLSRRTTQDTDLLLIITDSSVRGIMTAGRIADLVQELKLNVKRPVLIVNRVQEGTSDDPALRAAIEQQGVEFAGFIPADELIFEYDLNGRPLIGLPAGSKALTSFFSILDKLVP